MVKAFDQMRLMVSKYMDPAIASRDYDAAINMMANGDAAFFIMGDWAIGNLKAAGYKPGEDILCQQAPTDWADAGRCHPERQLRRFLHAEGPGVHRRSAAPCSPHHDTRTSRRSSTSPRVRSRRVSTSICRVTDGTPVSCKSQVDLKASIEAGALQVRSMAHNMTVLQKFRGAMMDTITEFVNSA